MERPMFSRSLEVQAVLALIADDTHADMFTYDELSAAIGSDIRKNRGALSSARRIVQRERGLIFEAVRGSGVRRCTDSDIVKCGPKHISRARSAARNGIKAAACVKDFGALKPDEQVRHHANSSVLGVLYHMTTQTVRKKIESRVTACQKSLPVGETLAAMRKEDVA